MPEKSVREMNRFERLHYSLGARMFHAILIFAVALSAVAVAFGFYLYSNAVNREYQTATWHMAKTAAALIDEDEVRSKAETVLNIYDEENGVDASSENAESKEYQALFDGVKDASFARICRTLRTVQLSGGGVVSYIAALDQDSGRMIFLIDADNSDSFCPPGTWDQLKTSYVNDFINGGKVGLIGRILGNESLHAVVAKMKDYGYRCTAGEKLFDINGYTVMVFVDSDMNHVASVSRLFLVQYIILLLLISLIFAYFLVRRMKKTVVGPINEIAAAAEAYSQDKAQGVSAEKHFDALDISTGDEIESLAFTMKDMENDIGEYIRNITRITSEKERMNTELDVASRIQESMIPHIFPVFPDRPEFDVVASMDTAKEVGGDFYDMFLIDDDHLGIVMADVSGKGIPAALFMMASKIMIKNSACAGNKDDGAPSPAAVLANVNEQICQNNSMDMFVTVWLGILDIKTGIITATSAGHEYPAIQRNGAGFELLKDKHGFVLGGMQGIKYKDYTIELSPGDYLFQYTDGVTEATTDDGELFGTDRMIDALNRNKNSEPKDELKDVRDAIDEFIDGADQFDDITMLCLRYNGADAKGGKHMARELRVRAERDNLNEVLDFLENELDEAGCPGKTKAQIDVVAEEVFVNIASYAYGEEGGDAKVTIDRSNDDDTDEGEQVATVTIAFTDSGKPYNPLSREDPDITLPAEEREIGGLGVLMVKKMMDDVRYEYKDGHNVLTMIKKI